MLVAKSNIQYIKINIFFLLDNDNSIYTKKITLTPRFIIVNNVNEEIVIRQFDTKQKLLVGKNMRIPYLWFDSQQK